MESNETIQTINNDRSRETQRLTFWAKTSFGVGHVLNDICASMWFTYLLVYFHFVLGFSRIYSGIVLLIGQVADALATPFVGFHSDKNDNYWMCRYGKRKTWHLLGTFCILCAFPFIFSECIGCKNAHQWAQLIYYAAFVTIFQFGWAAVQISHLSLIPDLTLKEDERTSLTAIRYSFTVFSNVFVYGITWLIFHLTGDNSSDAQIGPADADKFQKVVLIGMAVGLLATSVFHTFVQENPLSNTIHRRRTISTSAILKDPKLYLVACVYMPTRLFVNLTQVYMPLYLHETLHMAATSLAIIPLVMFLGSFKASIVIRILNKKCGRKYTYFIGVILGVGACIWIWYGQGENYVRYFIYPVSLFLGFGGSIMLVTSLAVTADYIGHATENGAFVYGLMSFSDKLCNGFAVMAIQYAPCSPHCALYYRNILVFVCGLSAVFGLFMLLLIKPFMGNEPSTGYRHLESEVPQEISSEAVEER